MKVILTGASGFLGKHIYNELMAKYEVLTISRQDADFKLNLSLDVPQLPTTELVVHCAGKAHSIPNTSEEIKAFFDVNLTGTANLLAGLSNNSTLPKAFVFISTVAVYGCESGNMINEDHPLNATDPYGESKIKAERLVQDWCGKNNVICAILRLPLLVGENPPGNLGSMIKGIKNGYYFNIGGGKARKSMVFAKDIAKIIPKVAHQGGVYNFTDGYHPSFSELALVINKTFGKKRNLNMPLWIANAIAKLGDLLGDKAPLNSKKLKKITTDLTFDDSKAKKELNWNPMPVLSGWK
ncbi:NAD-dependent epimerase/dehydratase family protein [Pedobacter agri]|uniref:NAD-dependent epimerase/dehydratase family protein n=1 Tax=Pedobacter agri TaxID=454586 RepID=UPI00292DFC90|nr:NAD-dependent epimerase/dehydratase family protein [Pedobacter agri]